jgi:uncharacterized membrane protein (UPF0127 family)
MTDSPAPSKAVRRLRIPGTRPLQWLIVVLLIAGGVAFITIGADKPTDPYLVTTREPITGFGEIAYRVNRSPDATRCALLAQTASQQAKGLMGQTDLAGFDGMLFVFPTDTTQTFWMKDTPLPLSIAWFDSAGRFVSSADMEPCLDKPECPSYSAAAPYRYALEVPTGGLGELGIGPGAVVSVGGPCA